MSAALNTSSSLPSVAKLVTRSSMAMVASKRAPMNGKPFAKKPKLLQAPTDNPNAEHLQQVADNYNVILSHSLFEDIVSADPIQITEGEGNLSGHQSVYKAAEFATSIMETGHYKCAYNLMAVDFMWNSSPRVPIRRSTIPKLMKHYFKAPCLFPGEVVVAVGSAEDDVNTLKGELHAVSPQEVRDALLFRIAEVINQGESEESEAKSVGLSWDALCRTTSRGGRGGDKLVVLWSGGRPFHLRPPKPPRQPSPPDFLDCLDGLRWVSAPRPPGPPGIPTS